MDKNCTIYKTANFVGKRWTILILLELYKGQSEWKRYSHLKNSLPKITPKILSLRLKELANEGMLLRKIDTKTFPIKSEYGLTEKGKDFINVIKNMKVWALKWKMGNEHCNSVNCDDCVL